jgi:DHA2 family multidrug resistance protein-like MFS transporter
MIQTKWLAMAVISAARFLIGIDMTVLYTALPTLTHALNASNSEKLWVANAYQPTKTQHL